MDLGSWLRSLGLAQYEAAFRENAINEAILPKLTAEDLKDMGVTAVGHRRVLLDAIAALRGETAPKQENAPSAATEPANKPNRVGGALPEAERRQLTVMFCDLVGSTALSARFDPEDLRGVISAYHRCCTELVERNGGFVAKYMGDGVLTYFGYPQAHEHDAERAVRAGLNLVEAVPKLATNVGSPLQVRIGIATGLVVVGDLTGAGAAQEQAVVGETPNLAARLQALAQPGAVVIASSTRRLTGGLFEYRDLGAVALKGFAEDIPAWQVLGVGTTESRFEALRATTTPLIGRDEEIDLLMRRWEQAKRGEGCVVLISGEAGIGKSRIAQTVAERISAEPHTRLRYYCSPHHQDSALYPSIAQLERAAAFRREDTADQRLDKLEAVLAEGTKYLSKVVPLLADLLSIPTGDRYPPLDLTPQKRKEKTLDAQLAQVEGLAARQPVLMVWEDVHWSDPTTRESLDLLIDRVLTRRVLVIIAFRPEFAPPWIGRPHVTLLSLSRLPERHRAEMITYLTGGKPLPEEIADQIVHRTDGVPLFIEELTKTVVESGILREASDHYAIAGPVAPLAIPTSLHGSLLARLDRLASTREVVQIGAALGRSFSHQLISAAAQIPHGELDDALKQLVSAEMIFRRGTPPDAEYTFKHALVQDAAYSTLLRSRRQQLHGRIATTLEAQFPEIVETQPEILAHHWAEAGQIDKAVAYRLAAGERAVARSAMTEALAQLSKGLDLMKDLPESDWRQQQELGLLIPMGQALIATKGFGALSVTEVLARARQLCEKLDRPREIAAVLYGEFVQHLIRGELATARQKAEQMRRLGEAKDDRAVLLMGCRSCGVSRYYLGEFAAAASDLEQGSTLFEPAHRSFYAAVQPHDAHVALLVYSSRNLVCLGFLDQARRRAEQALQEARQLSHAYTMAYALANGWVGQWDLRSKQDMLQCAEELVTVTSEHGFRHFWAMGLVLRGWCLAAVGKEVEAMEQLAHGLSRYRELEAAAKLDVPFFLALLADAHGRARAPEEGLKRLTEAEYLIEVTGERWAEAELHRIRGRLQQTSGSCVSAEGSFHQAIHVARLQNARFWELRAATNLARLWRDQGKRRQAHDLLAPIYGWFTEGFDTLDLKEAKALLEEFAS
jgi:class 3 adenylate cyclase/predicted ATPase